MDTGTAEDRYYDRMLNEYLDSRELECVTCAVCKEQKPVDEFDCSQVCIRCESDGEYMGDGDFFCDAGGHVIKVEE